MFKKTLNEGQAGDNCGLLLRGLKRDEVLRGQLLCKPGSVETPRVAEVYVLKMGRPDVTTPFFSNGSSDKMMRTARATGNVTLPVGRCRRHRRRQCRRRRRRCRRHRPRCRRRHRRRHRRTRETVSSISIRRSRSLIGSVHQCGVEQESSNYYSDLVGVASSVASLASCCSASRRPTRAVRPTQNQSPPLFII